jgi:hypothetical protein
MIAVYHYSEFYGISNVEYFIHTFIKHLAISHIHFRAGWFPTPEVSILVSIPQVLVIVGLNVVTKGPYP